MEQQIPKSTEGQLFVQYMAFKAAPEWRRMPQAARDDLRAAFAEVVQAAAPAITTYAYSTIGMKLNSDLLLWRKGTSPVAMQEMTSRLLQTGMGLYLEPTYSFFGYTRPSSYTKRPTTQEQAIDIEDRQTYLIVYPFTKTADWYMMSRDARQGMMNEHIRVGHEYADVRQILLYTTGIDDHEFIVAYETDDLPRFQALVIDLRATEARRYTLNDTPIITGISRPLDEALSMIG